VSRVIALPLRRPAGARAGVRAQGTAGVALLVLSLALEAAFLVHVSLVDRSPGAGLAAVAPVRAAAARCQGRPGERC
jgi:hypothetical protein